MAAQQHQLWTLEQLRIACGFYFTLPFGRMHKTNPEIIALSRVLDRTPSSLAMKLTQFASLDPEHRARGVRGLTSTSRGDKQVWEEFQANWPESIASSQIAKRELEHPLSKPTEDLRLTKVRLEQAAFRTIVLAAYRYQCCLTGNPISQLLVASHIFPWSEFPAHRLDPRNGLCLSAEFDKAFDRHLIAFDNQLQLLLSPQINREASNSYVFQHLLACQGTALQLTERFAPSPEFLTRHRDQLVP